MICPMDSKLTEPNLSKFLIVFRLTLCFIFQNIREIILIPSSQDYNPKTMAIGFEFTPTKNEQMTLYRAMMKKLLLQRIKVVIILMILLGVLFSLIIKKRFDENTDNWSGLLNFPIFMLILLVFAFLIVPFLMTRFVTQKSSKYLFDDRGMIYNNGLNSLHYSWNEISNYSEFGSFFQIHIRTQQLHMHFIPKKCFDSEKDLTDFIDLLEQNGVLKTIE